MACFHRAVVVATERLPCKFGIEAVQRNARIVNHEIDTVSMVLLEVLRERFNALAVGDIQGVVFHFRKPSIGFQCLRSFQLFIFVEALECSLSTAGVSSGEVDGKWAIVERRLGISECKLSDWRSLDW